MIIRRKFRFYAAHRNAALADKCARLHGHRYGVEVDIEVNPAQHGVGILFAAIDRMIGPVFEAIDHRTMLHNADSLIGTPEIADTAYIVPFPTSAENIAAHLLDLCRRRIPSCKALRLQETDSAVIIVTTEDLSQWPTDTK